MLQLFGYLFTYTCPVLINAFGPDDLFLTAEILRKCQSNRFFLGLLRFIALIRVYFTGGILDCFLLFRKYVKAIKIYLTPSRIYRYVLFTGGFSELTP